MMNPSNTAMAREKIVQLVEAMEIPKFKLGELLGGKGDAQNVKINRANRFLRGETKRLTLEQVERIAEYFHLPVQYFFGQYEISSQLQSPVKQPVVGSEQMYYQQIANALRDLGFDETFITLQLEQIQAVRYFRQSQSE